MHLGTQFAELHASRATSRTILMIMAELLGNSWIVVAAMIAFSVLAILYMLAVAIRSQIHSHDLQVNVARLQQKYIDKARAMQNAAQMGEVELVVAEEELPKKKAA